MKDEVIIISSFFIILFLFIYIPTVSEISHPIQSSKGSSQPLPLPSKCFDDFSDAVLKQNDNGTIVWTLSNEGYGNLTDNLVASLHELDITNFLVISLDAFYAQSLANRNIPCYLWQWNTSSSEASGFFPFGSKGFREIVRLKPLITYEIGKMGVNQLFVDGDVVILRNPLDYIVHHPLTPHTDYWTQDDTYTPCTGFYYLKATSNSVRLYENILIQLSKQEDQMEQYAQMEVLKGYEETGEALVWRYLPRELFPNGLVYFDYLVPQQLGITPYIIHNNFVIGKHLKLLRFKEIGYDFIDPLANVKEGKFLYLKHGPEMSKANAKDGFYNAIAYAYILNRTLILPLFPCEEHHRFYRMCDVTAFATQSISIKEFDIEKFYLDLYPMVPFRENYLMRNPLFQEMIGDDRVEFEILLGDYREGKEGSIRIQSNHSCGLSYHEIIDTFSQYNEKLLLFSNLTHRFQGFPSNLSMDDFYSILQSCISYSRKERIQFMAYIPICKWYFH